MLQYMGAHQPPRKYPIAPDFNSTPRDVPLCESCTSNVWTLNLFSTLQSASPEELQFTTSYQVGSSALRTSVMGGCRWCRTLADGIHGRIFLDAMYKKCAIPESWLEEGSVSENDDGNKDAKNEANSEWDAASDFNDEKNHDDEDEYDDSTDGWSSYEDKDTLAALCNFEVELSFKRQDGGLFSFLTAHIETVGEVRDQDKRNAVWEIRGEKAVNLRYHISMSGVTISHAESFPLTVTEANLGSVSNLQTICDWLKRSDYLTAPLDTDSLSIPSRLIDISDGKLRIIETSRLACSETEHSRGFAALSYVWGTNQTFVLLSTTIDKFMSGFNVRNLPQTIQDAVTVAQRLEFRYLWVDALCIMQDSDADKATELPKMRQIYQKASVTIVAAASKTATEGFLHMAIETLYFIDPITIPYHHPNESSPKPELILSYPAAYLRQKDPINDRAWTFQEWILPPRLISFSYRGIETIDRRNITDPDGLTSGKDVQLPNLPWHGNFYTLDPDGENLRQRWLSTRDEYSRRMLTYGGDKLVAIAAVAEELGRSYKCKYLAGLWEQDLELDLQWARVDQPHSAQEVSLKPRAKEYIAPTWSWASVVGEIEDRASDVARKCGSEYLDFSIVSCEVKNVVPEFKYGAVSSGTLVVKGRVRSFFWRPEKSLELVSCDGYLAVRGDSDPYPETIVGEVWIDALEPEIVDGCVVDCLAMSLIELVQDKEEIEGLVLFSADQERHRRVGYFKVFVEALFDDIKAMYVRID